MTALTPWGAQAEAAPSDTRPESLQLVRVSAVDDRDETRHAGVRLPRALRSARVWLVAADVAVTSTVLAVLVARDKALTTSPATLVLFAALWCTAALANAGRRSDSALAPGPGSVGRTLLAVGLCCWTADALLDLRVTSAQLLALTAALAVAAVVPRAVLLAAVRTWHPVRVVIAGEGDDVRRLLLDLDRGPASRWRVTAVCVDDEDADGHAAAQEHGMPTYRGIGDVVSAAADTGATGVLLAPGRDLCPATARRLSWLAHDAGLDVFLATGLLDVAAARATLVAGGDRGLIHLRPTTTPSLARRVKGVTERALAALALLAFLPLLVAIGVAIRVDSAGGSLFRQTRVGRDGRTFTMYKFRTMEVDADRRVASLADDNESDGVLFKMRRDPRITRIGGLLRRYSLDELPQLLNVLLGHMSLVGPRPALPQEVERYGVEPHHRLAVKPGLTGLWQVSGRSDLSWEESVRLDLHYVDNWSLAMDVEILLRTVRAVVGHRGAY
ncbi:sugar transferase [Nocardioides conyzicola]|uniref:sugar transferase n=1 Tax=Nocardioides conyzicola TaxID=1651781 RepID=UPI0031E8FA61